MGNKANRKKHSKMYFRNKQKQMMELVRKRKQMSSSTEEVESSEMWETKDSQNTSATSLTPLGNVEIGAAAEKINMQNHSDTVNDASPKNETEQQDADSLNSRNLTGDQPYLVEINAREDLYVPVQGRRIVNIMHFIHELQKISSHNSLFDCSLKDMILIGEKRNGLISKYKFRCNMCKENFIVTDDDPESEHNINVNLAAVTGITSAGIGYSQFEEITACMNIPVFSQRTYLKIQDIVYQEWEATSVESMEKAAKRERDAAIAKGNISKDGIPIVDVYADGVWSSRSYGSNYKALSGAAAIVGRTFGEVLFIGIKNKYCLVCARAEKKQIPTPDHVCYKNYTGSSSGMESEIICQGFATSIAMHGIIYGRLIADGDSATYAKILARNPYPNHTVQKIECRNHLLRNLCNKLRSMTKETKYPLVYRKTLSEVKIMTIRKVVIASIKKYKPEKEKPETLTNFRNDVQNSIYHAFGNHEKCNNYYCSKDKTAQSNIEIENTTFWFRINTIIQAALSKSTSLLEDVDTNIVECFNSVVAKIVGGKRINFSLRRGYRARCSAAVLSFNESHPRHTLHKKMLGRSPRSILKKFEGLRLKKRNANKANPHKKNRELKRCNTVQHDYGSQNTSPDMTPEELLRSKEQFLENLKQLTADKDQIQKCTLNQRDSSDWFELRKNMITASNFGTVAKRRDNSSKAKLVQNILYKSNLSHLAAIAHGVDNEKIALQQLALQENVTIAPCGLFVDNEFPFIGATPDGLIGQDTVVEIKCPIVALKNGLANTIKENKIQIWKHNKKDDVTTLNKNSDWYYQIQGQLHVTGKKNCLFAVWSGENTPLKTENIERDDVFWETKLKDKLVSFYMDWLLPEIVDSRRARGMPLREKNKEIKNTSPKSDKKVKESLSRVEENKTNRKRKLPLEISTTFLVSSNAYNREHEPHLKRQLNFEDATTSSIIDGKENLPCCRRQLNFQEL